MYFSIKKAKIDGADLLIDLQPSPECPIPVTETVQLDSGWRDSPFHPFFVSSSGGTVDAWLRLIFRYQLIHRTEPIEMFNLSMISRDVNALADSAIVLDSKGVTRVILAHLKVIEFLCADAFTVGAAPVTVADCPRECLLAVVVEWW